MLTKYIYHPQTNQPIGVVVALSSTQIGWSQCCPKDKWNKKRGLEIAIGRAKKGYMRKPAKTRLHNLQHTKNIDLITPEIEMMDLRARRYFKEKTTPHNEKEYLLSLTKDEIQFIYDVFYKFVAGNPKKSRRKYADSIRNKLIKTNIDFDNRKPIDLHLAFHTINCEDIGDE